MANKKRIMTVQDLVKFCETNQLYSFNSQESGSQIFVRSEGQFEEEFKEEDGLLYLRVKVFHDGLNRNGSYITKANMKKSLPSFKYKPILAHIHQLDDGEWDFHAHDMVIGEDGETEYIEKQVGNFTTETPKIEYDEERDRNYAIAYAVISTQYTKAAEIIKRKKGTKVSCELVIDSFSYNSKEKYLELIDFSLTGCCLLGAEKNGHQIGEGMEGARADLVEFSHQTINEKVDDTKELIKVLNALNTTLAKFQEKGGNSKVKFKELLEKYGKTEADVQFEVECLTDEELENKFEEAFGEENSVEDEVSEGEIAEGEFTEGEFTEDETNEDDFACGTKKKKTKCDEEEHEEEQAEETFEGEESGEGSTEGVADEGETSEGEITEGSTDEGSIDEEEHEEEQSSEDEVTEVTEVTETEVTENPTEDEARFNLKATVTLGKNTMEFATSLNEKIYALTELVNITYSESDNAYYSVEVFDKEVVMVDYWSGRAYRQEYKVRSNSYTLVGDRVSVHARYVTDDEDKALDELRGKFSALEAKLQEYELADEKEKVKAALMSDDYVLIFNSAEYKELTDSIETMSKEDLDGALDKADKIMLAYIKNKKFALNDNHENQTEKKKVNKVTVFSQNENKVEDNPYKTIFELVNKIN